MENFPKKSDKLLAELFLLKFLLGDFYSKIKCRFLAYNLFLTVFFFLSKAVIIKFY